MSYNATYGGPEIDPKSFLSFKQHNDLFVKNYADMTFDDIYNYYFVVLWFLVTSGLSVYAVKQFYLLCVMIWNYRGDEYDEEDGDEDGDRDVEEIPYENRYFKEYDDLEEKDLTEDFVKDLTLNVIREETPKGEVLMYYSHEHESFIYYAKTKEIPYKYLETLARKYVIIYDCKKLYIDIRKEYEKGLNKYKELKENKTIDSGSGSSAGGDKNENKKKQLFASFKTYNRKGEVNAKQKDKIYILREKANRYSYRGKIEEYKEDKRENEQSCDDTTMEKKIDFSSFKKLNIT
jgi:hypothetical protein